MHDRVFAGAPSVGVVAGVDAAVFKVYFAAGEEHDVGFEVPGLVDERLQLISAVPALKATSAFSRPRQRTEHETEATVRLPTHSALTAILLSLFSTFDAYEGVEFPALEKARDKGVSEHGTEVGLIDGRKHLENEGIFSR